MSQGEKNVQSDLGSNLGPLAYRASALSTELSSCLTHYLPYGDEVCTVTYTPHKFWHPMDYISIILYFVLARIKAMLNRSKDIWFD